MPVASCRAPEHSCCWLCVAPNLFWIKQHFLTNYRSTVELASTQGWRINGCWGTTVQLLMLLPWQRTSPPPSCQAWNSAFSTHFGTCNCFQKEVELVSILSEPILQFFSSRQSNRHSPTPVLSLISAANQLHLSAYLDFVIINQKCLWVCVGGKSHGYFMATTVKSASFCFQPWHINQRWTQIFFVPRSPWRQTPPNIDVHPSKHRIKRSKPRIQTLGVTASDPDASPDSSISEGFSHKFQLLKRFLK